MNSYRKFEQLRQKLLSGESLNAGEATGDAVAKMLKEIEETGNLEGLYCVPSAEVQQRIEQFKQCMGYIKMGIEALWKPSIELRDRTLTTTDLAVIYPTITGISFVGCRSK
jgi:hypothetical protein